MPITVDFTYETSSAPFHGDRDYHVTATVVVECGDVFVKGVELLKAVIWDEHRGRWGIEISESNAGDNWPQFKRESEEYLSSPGGVLEMDAKFRECAIRADAAAREPAGVE